ncbi:methyltransferase PMT3 [Pyrus ussuriensis x Pyrus communis]|uniref:Methyltransferase n=1 Tax=Pyrus ussuriensis x Pyrus communis TaxID=2448454 RepID=A0A5N5FNJ7_9ROSA|nr:methyltransferase PMT3 [Pyrus ussuriensis x Pyrus communis]
MCIMGFSSQSYGASSLKYDSRSLRKLGSSCLGEDEDNNKKQDESSTKSGQENGEDNVTLKSFPVCDDRHLELIPYLDKNLIYQMRLKFDLSLIEHYERHCPIPKGRFNCLILPPPRYNVLFRDEVWKANIHHTYLAHEKFSQNWMVKKCEKIKFPGGDTHFHCGANKYIASIANVRFPSLRRLRIVFYVGYRVASFGAYLLSSDIIAISLAPNDGHQNQIQFVLERGILAYVDEIFFLELDRLLKPRGYFAYSSPEAYAQDEEDLKIWREMSAFVERMCWRRAAKQNQTIVWQKPLPNDCYVEREPGTQPPLCQFDNDWMQYRVCQWKLASQHTLVMNDHTEKGSGLAPWLARLTAYPPQLADFGYSNEMFKNDTEVRPHIVESYWNLMSKKIESNTLRNANMRSFAATLKDKDVWVTEDGPNTLKLIYAGMQIKCEAYSTYPQTYDLLHECNVEDLLLGMDRILRPTGFVIICDKQSVVDFVKNSDLDQDGDDVMFIIQKKIWLTSESLKDSE